MCRMAAGITFSYSFNPSSNSGYISPRRLIMLKLFSLFLIGFFALSSSIYAQNSKPLIYLCSTGDSLAGQPLNGDLVVVDALSLQEIDRIPLENFAADDIALSPDAKLAFIASDLGT